MKSLEANYEPVEGISGATILGNGRVALILDVARLHEIDSQSSFGRFQSSQVARTETREDMTHAA